MVDFSNINHRQPFLRTRSLPRRRPNSSRRLRPGISPGNTELVPAQATPRDSLNRIGSASPLPQPVLRCKRRSQLCRDRTPKRPHMLHSLPCRYEEGDVDTVADGTSPPARDALRTAEQTPGQHQGSRLMDTEPVTLYESNPANDGTESRVDLKYFHSLTAPPGDEARPDLAVAETGQHPAVPGGLPL